ncbi:hypothetical protein L218DRAFT_1009388 [Marasmius fiardii PR-910]|nr:hypothetical protein L218DRAFT_1009388 [Marasmius fiardii PR-910]
MAAVVVYDPAETHRGFDLWSDPVNCTPSSFFALDIDVRYASALLRLFPLTGSHILISRTILANFDLLDGDPSEDPIAQDYAPKLDAGLSLLSLFGLTSTTARIFTAFTVTLILGCLFIHFRYPCRSPAHLMQVVDHATNLYNMCLDMRAFNEREYGKFTLLLNRVTVRASQIAARANSNSTQSSLYREYLK